MSGRSKFRAVVVGGVLLLAVVVRFAHHGGEQASPASSSVAASASPTVTGSPSPSPSPTLARVDSGPHEDMDPAAAAEAWVRIWLDTSGTGGKPDKAAWLARLKPITEAQLYAGLELTDIARVPHATVQPGAGAQPVEGRADVSASVPTTAGAVLVTMTVLNARLIATSVDWAPGPSGAGT